MQDDDRWQADLAPRAAEALPPPPVEPEWVDGEEVYTVYRPADDDREARNAHDAA
ncbi:MAG: hypothetical protein HOQ45_12225 [Nocardioidaceae bacterium]|nr:hypothetical protein [Nocardioidaceae bacterium]